MGRKFAHNWFLAYFMRSYSRRQNGTHVGYPIAIREPFVYPMTYPIAEAYTHHEFYHDDRRDFEILCTSSTL
jgi:hypothetical protein